MAPLFTCVRVRVRVRVRLCTHMCVRMCICVPARSSVGRALDSRRGGERPGSRRSGARYMKLLTGMAQLVGAVAVS